MTVRLSKADLKKIANGRALYEILQKVLARDSMLDKEKEHLWVCGLDTKHYLKFIELVTLGNDYKTTADAVSIFSLALSKGCRQIILAHNHPGDILDPSDEDIQTTKGIVAIGRFLSCEVYDHLIINEHYYYSFRDCGLIKQMKRMGLKEIIGEQKVIQILLDSYRKENESMKKELEELKKQKKTGKR